MRTENIEVTFRIPLPINKPDGNGVMYSKEAFEKISKEDIYNCPITVCGDDTYDVKVIGACKSANVEADYLVVDGYIWSGGTSEAVNLSDQMVVTDMAIQSVGIDIDRGDL